MAQLADALISNIRFWEFKSLSLHQEKFAGRKFAVRSEEVHSHIAENCFYCEPRTNHCELFCGCGATGRRAGLRNQMLKVQLLPAVPKQFAADSSQFAVEMQWCVFTANRELSTANFPGRLAEWMQALDCKPIYTGSIPVATSKSFVSRLEAETSQFFEFTEVVQLADTMRLKRIWWEFKSLLRYQ